MKYKLIIVVDADSEDSAQELMNAAFEAVNNIIHIDTEDMISHSIEKEV